MATSLKTLEQHTCVINCETPTVPCLPSSGEHCCSTSSPTVPCLPSSGKHCCSTSSPTVPCLPRAGKHCCSTSSSSCLCILESASVESCWWFSPLSHSSICSSCCCLSRL